MLAPLAIVALLIGGTQTALVVSEQEVAETEQVQVFEVETVDTINTTAE